MTTAKSRRAVRDSTQPRQQIARVAEQRAVHEAFTWFRANEETLSRWQMEVTRIPAPPFGEAARAEWLKKRFEELGLEQVEIDGAGNVIGVRAGSGDGNGCVA